jgi:hypothetical protein
MPTTHCRTCTCTALYPCGHPRTEDNTIERTYTYRGEKKSKTECRTCHQRRGVERYHRKRERLLERAREKAERVKEMSRFYTVTWCACGDIRDVHGDDGCRVPSCGCSGFRPERRQTGGAMEVRA